METPPLTRGRPSRPHPTSNAYGNTPAYAGKTILRHGYETVLKKHPRLRGEDVIKVDRALALVETPPLTRGRPQLLSPDAVERGNTPAYAGKTLRGFRSLSFSRKHPRLRGEDAPISRSPPMKAETPPLTRGRLAVIAGSEDAPPKHPRLRGED